MEFSLGAVVLGMRMSFPYMFLEANWGNRGVKGKKQRGEGSGQCREKGHMRMTGGRPVSTEKQS